MGTILSQQNVGESLLATDVAGTTDYTFKQMRQLSQAFASGVLDAASFKVTQRGAGANMSVDVADGAAWIAGTTDATYDGQQKYGVPGVSAVVNLSSITAPVGATRRDIVVLRAYDNAEDGGMGVSNEARVQYIKNAAETTTAEATPANSELLAYVDVTVGAGSIVTAMITDMRRLAVPGASAVAGLSGATAVGLGSQVPFNTPSGPTGTSAIDPGLLLVSTGTNQGVKCLQAGLYMVTLTLTLSAGTTTVMLTADNGATYIGPALALSTTVARMTWPVRVAAGATIAVSNTGSLQTFAAGSSMCLTRIGA